MAEPVLDIVPKYPEKEHVAGYVNKPAVDEHGRQERVRQRHQRAWADVRTARYLKGYRSGLVDEELHPIEAERYLVDEYRDIDRKESDRNVWIGARRYVVP